MLRPVVVGVVAGVVALLGAAGAARGEDPASGLRVAVAGSPAAPELVVTNGSAQACQVADTSFGTTVLTRVTQGGKAVQPASFTPTFDDGVDHYLASRLRTLAAGASVRFSLSLVPTGTTGHALETVAWSDATAPLGSLYAVDTTAPYSIEVTYAVPVAASAGTAPICGAAEAQGSVSGGAGAKSASQGTKWWLIAAAAVVVLLLLLLIALLARRRKSRTAQGTALILILLACGIVQTGVGAPRAAADITVSGDVSGAWGPCSGLLNGPGGDPGGILPTLKGPNVHVQIQGANGDQTHQLNVGGNSIILWNTSDHHKYAGGGGNADPCDSLYHELYHAYENANGGQNHADCWYTGADGKPANSHIPVTEVNATRAQNQLRAKEGLPQRTHYGDNPLPPPGPCQPPPPPTPPPGCSGPGCAGSNGDPHLITFDGARYDFQAAGEFVAARDPRGGYQIQVRQRPFGASTTIAVNTAVAFDVAGDKVEVDLDPAAADPVVLVGGTPAADPSQVNLPGGGRIGTESATFGVAVDVTWPDGSVATVSKIGRWGLKLSAKPAAARAGHLEGLFGNFNGDPADDIRPAGGGQPIAIPPSFAALYPTFADGWRITQGTSLFTYSAGTDTTTYTDRSFPHQPVAVETLPNVGQAKTICAAAGITDPAVLADCELDVALTGRPDFALADAGSQTQGGTPTPGTTPSSTPSPSLSATPVPANGTVSIDGAPVQLTLGTPGATARLHFSATAGQKVFIDVSTTTIPSSCGALELDKPDGGFLAGGCVISGNGYIDGTVLPATGQYTIVVRPNNNGTGSLTLRVIADADQSGPITADGAPVTAVIGQPGAVSRFTFDGTAGQQVFLAIQNATIPSECGVAEFDAPSGFLTSGCVISGTGYIQATVLPTNGRYTVLINPGARGTGQATLSLFTDHDQIGAILIGGPSVTATIVQPGATSTFAFPAKAGQRVTVTATSATLPSQCGVLRILDPSGKNAGGSGCIINGKGSIDPTTLPISGLYQIVVNPDAGATGSVTLSLTEAR